MVGAETHRFVALDSLRGVVALIVAAHHLNARSPIFGLPFFAAGVQCVDFFFVLSGFVIAASYGERLAGGYPPTRFLWLRAGRIWPAHVAMVLCYVAIEVFVATSGAVGLTGREAFTGPRDPADLPATLLLLQCLWPDACMTWNVQSWSISVELLLYLLVAFGWRRVGQGWWIVALGLGVLAGLLVDQSVLVGWEKLWRGLCGFGLGVALWRVWLGGGAWLKRMPAMAATLAEAALLLLVGWIFTQSRASPPILPANLAFAAAVLVFAAQRGALSRLLLKAPLVLAGTISYSIYMVHPLVETGVLKAIRLIPGATDLLSLDSGSARPVPSGDWHADLLGAVALAAVFLAAWLFFRLFEWPIRQWSRRRLAAMPA